MDMMLHRHFDNDYQKENLTKSADSASSPAEGEGFNSEIFPPEENIERPKRGRKKKTEE